MVCHYNHHHVKVRGVATGVYRDIYPPNQSTLNFLCGCFVSLTQDKFDIVQFIPTQIKFLATPLVKVLSLRQLPPSFIFTATCFSIAVMGSLDVRLSVCL